ncbi:hypothetical protein F4819DRAFT_479991 [Hypoxylon fuscum]|nr:hypothetical protein F4819DRAFT_479991 [Hypoxylon fuscum]
MSTGGLGPLVRLWGLRTEQLPAATASTDELAPFLISILQEAVPFIDSAAPKKSTTSGTKLWKSKGSHSHADSAAKVEVLERVIPAAELERVAAGSAKVGAETWCCRRSVHEDKEQKGTASWEEFEHCFREAHAQSEKAFTPACLAAHEALRWNCAGVEAHEGGLAWTGFQLVVEEMRHRIGKPVLKDRTFPVLQMTCAAARGNEFVVVSIPLPDFGAKSKASKLASEKGAQVAFYVSVERIRRLEGGVEGQGGSIEWLMATASDAGGVLPAWVQNLAAPGVIWKDVPLFLGWIAKERNRQGKAKEVVSNGAGKGEEDRGETLPQASTGVDVGGVPTVSGATSSAEASASDSPLVTTGVEVGKTAQVSGSG